MELTGVNKSHHRERRVSSTKRDDNSASHPRSRQQETDEGSYERAFSVPLSDWNSTHAHGSEAALTDINILSLFMITAACHSHSLINGCFGMRLLPIAQGEAVTTCSFKTK